MRTCERCGGRMRPFVARKTVDGKRVCEGCASAPMTGRRRSAGFKNLAALENPAPKNGRHPEEWFHGSPHHFEHFGDPADHQDPEMEEYTDRYKHWNTLVGNHFASDHAVAKEFSGGDHTHSDDLPDDYEGPMGHVVHVKLHLKNPKVYASEHDMDQEVYEHEWENGNHHDKHMDPPPEDDDEYEEWAEGYGHRRHYAGDSQHKYSKNEPDPNYAYGFHPKATGWLNTHPDKEGIVQRYKDRMKRAGYDGVVYGNEYEGGGKSAIAFEPHQIEITQHHYGEQECLHPDEAKRRAVHPDQQVLPGLEDVKRKVPERQRPDLSKHWPTTFTPSFTDNIPRYAAKGAQRYDTGRLWAPLPQECWDRYYGRHTASQRLAASQDMLDLFHGTSADAAEMIRSEGLQPARENHPTLTTDRREAEEHASLTESPTVLHFRVPKAVAMNAMNPSPGDHEGHLKFAPTSRLHPSFLKTSALGEESARQHAGQQDVYAVRSGNSMVTLCRHHADAHVGNSGFADDLADRAGIGQRERSAEILGEARKGSCAACNRDTGYQLKLLTPRWMQNAQDSRARRRPDKPMRTRPLPTLKQSENIRRAIKGSLFYADTGYGSGVRFHPNGTPQHMGDHTVPVGAEVHHDENEAWNKAIEHWKNGASYFPRVYVLHQPKHEDGRLTHEAEASELDYDHTRHPAIRSDDEEPHEPIMYHGTTKREDADDPEEITPSGGSQSFGPGVADPDYAYATPSLHDAWTYAHKRAENGAGGKPTVYRVTPHKPEDVEEDPKFSGDYSRGNYEHDKRSKSGFEVLDEVPMSQKQEHDWRRSPFNDEAENEDYGDEDDHHYASLMTLAEWDDEDDKPEWCEECGEEHTPDEGHRECAACGERHEDYEEKLNHESTMTDWDDVYPRLNSHVHRVLPHMTLPDHVHEVVHDESRPMAERGEALLKHVEDEHGHGLGMHWSDVFGEGRGHGADKFAGVGGGDERDTQVVLHARKPDRDDIETDPDTLDEHQVYGYDAHDENEVPIQQRAPVHITGVSWRPGGYHQEWRHHNVKEPIEMTAKRLPTLRMLAHDATENEALRHCPFCGAGKIIGRADGSVECEFCHHYFTVQVQPQYPNFPQTINGMPQQIPGMPGQVETPQMDGGGLPPGQEGDDTGDAPPWAQDGAQSFPDDAAEEKEAGDDEDEEEPPPFAKQSSLPVFHTTAGARLTEDDYVRHLAIRHARNRGAMIARIREERGAE